MRVIELNLITKQRIFCSVRPGKTIRIAELSQYQTTV
jgi:hypothetical protein